MVYPASQIKRCRATKAAVDCRREAILALAIRLAPELMVAQEFERDHIASAVNALVAEGVI